MSPVEAALLVAGACGTAAIIVISDNALLYFSGAIAAALLLAYALAALGSGNSQKLVLLWALFYPLAYYFVSFPREHSIFTLDRAFVAILTVVLLTQLVRGQQPLPKDIRYAGFCWAGFIGSALASLLGVRGNDLLYSLRVLIDAFVMPGILALYVIRNLDVRRYIPSLSVVVCLMSIYLAGIGAAEMVLNQNLLPVSDDMKLDFADGAGMDKITVVRANGPFDTTSTFALVGIFNFFLLCLFRQAMRGNLPAWQRRLQSIAMLMSAAVSMMTLHRGVVFSWIFIGLIEFWRNRQNATWWRRIAWKRLALVTSLSVALMAIKVMAPGIYENRVSDPSNLYGRIAQQRQTLAVFLDHLWVGAGFGQFIQVVSGEGRYRFFFRGDQSVGSPHNTLGSIAAETGLIGLVFFILSQLFLLAAFRRLLFTRTSGHLAWGIFISIFTAYWVVGMDLTSGYYSELNIWYMFAIAVCFRYAKTEDHIETTVDEATVFPNQLQRLSVNRYTTP